MGTYLGSARAFTFNADVTFDHVLPSGQKLQYAASEDVALQRPGRLYVEWSGDLGHRRFWYDGSTVTLYDPATPFYAAEAVPGDIDGMLEKSWPSWASRRRSPMAFPHLRVVRFTLDRQRGGAALPERSAS